MKSLIIALERKSERFLSSQKQLLNIKSLDIEKLSAVDAMSSKPHPLMDFYDETAFYALNGRIAVPGEIGCYGSHYLAWERCIQLNQPVIVFEDDVVVDVDVFGKTVQFASKHIEECGFMRLENYSTKREYNYVVENLDDEQSLVRHIKTPLCTTAYMITPHVAKIFIEKSERFLYPVDVFIRNVWLHKQPTYGISPAGLTGGEGGSVIGNRSSRTKKSLRIKTLKFLSKFRDVAMNGLFNLTYTVIIKKSRPKMFNGF
ncbi:MULTISPECIES: glycosyltransferase family 25 protein [Vibrio]|uniref:glycosyltransferase family 25 protein n=1 Tax=Vibrio TaxID=662 RepID=UPI0002D54354|nr:glycosyltransferase family 25 protein [Vibrio tasmaniensis]OEF78612.1 epitope biosynthesis protein [Vibrio tasmaniensis 1F-155]PMO86601.1 epitope biosynthesis protein [Vibrio tasmaniensis]